MTERKWTPGKWKWIDNPIAPSDKLISEINGNEIAVLESSEWLDVDEGDMHLIEAAPDLYDALEKLLMAQSGIPVNTIEFGTWVDDARAALAKARGEA